MEYPIDLPGGGQMSTETLCRGLVSLSGEGKEEGADEDGYEPVVICPSLLKKRPEDYPFKVVEYKALENREDVLFKRLINLFTRMLSFARLINREKPELIHVSMSESLLTFGFIRWLPFLSRYPFVYTDRGLCYGYRSHTRFLMRRILKHAGEMICTTGFNRDLWLKERPPVSITVIPNTIGEVFSHYDPEKRELMRKRFGLSEKDFVLGFAGRISEEKDWDLAPVLVRALKEAGVVFKVALVLSVYEKKDALICEGIRKGITEAVGEEGLIYMQDLSQSEICDYYYMVDVFVMTSVFESFGKAAVEAMSRRCAVVSTKAGGLREVVAKEENLYTKENPELFVNRIKRLSEDEEELSSDREFFYRRYLENYTLRTHVKKHALLYDRIINAFYGRKG